MVSKTEIWRLDAILVEFEMKAGNAIRSVLLAVVQSVSCVQFFMTPWAAARQVSLSFTISQSLLRFLSIESMIPSNQLILCSLLCSVFPSFSVFSNESAFQIRWPKYWSFTFNPNIQGWFSLGLTGLISLLSKELSRVFSSTTVWKHQFLGTQPSLWSNSHICIWLLEKS